MKNSRLVVGLMSGTSLDGIDAVLLRVSGDGARTSFRQLAYVERAFPRGLRDFVLRNSIPEPSRVDDIARLNFLLAELYADAVRQVARAGGVRMSQIALIGSHGQTIRHEPKPVTLFGKKVRATLQLGDPSVLATLTGVCTVGDFRVADMAAGGQGAPLVPYFDWLVFRSKSANRLVLNIGGIANVTVLPKKSSTSEVFAFDTGPGNMVVDSVMRRLYGRPFDRNGETAFQGTVLPDVFSRMIRHPYLRLKPPKSTGREEFGDEFVSDVLKLARRKDRRDVVATVSQFTAYAVYVAYRQFVQRRMRVDELIVSGGGAENLFFVGELRRYFGACSVRLSDEFGIPSDSKEAICFAILANETVAGKATNIPAVTGARRPVVLGKICVPAGYSPIRLRRQGRAIDFSR
jgi:anhydro-N-acetylmuramic acid kinase